MALRVATFPDPFDPTTPLTNAYAWVYDIVIILGSLEYFVTLWVHKSEGAASVVPPPSPLDRVQIHNGDILIPAVPAVPAIPADGDTPEVPEVPEVPAVLAPSLLEVFAQADAVKAAHPELDTFACLRVVIYGLASQHHKLSPCEII